MPGFQVGTDSEKVAYVRRATGRGGEGRWRRDGGEMQERQRRDGGDGGDRRDWE